MLFRGHLGDLCVKEFRWDSVPPVQAERRVDTRGKRRETAESSSCVPCVVNSSAVSLPEEMSVAAPIVA